ncbi:macro domain-containing protein [Phormidesmis sp. 146-12]
MIELSHGNLLDADVEAIVNTINCVGVMGKGLALQFKQRFPENFRQYQQACQAGEVKAGQMLIVPTGCLTNPRYIINFPTKRHWKNPSRLEDIQTGLQALITEVKRLGIRSIAVPPLGCGNGGLNWTRVAPLIESAFAELPEVSVLIFEPQEKLKGDLSLIVTAPPELNRARALLICLMEQYSRISDSLSASEIHKLAYLLQLAGEPLNLQFTKTAFGVFSANLSLVLQQLEGHSLQGYDDHDPWAESQLMPGAIVAAHTVLSSIPDAQATLRRISNLIEGFESPYGLELLTIMQWVTHEDPQAAASVEGAIKQAQGWSLDQQGHLKPQHIHSAWQHLRKQNCLFAAEPA